MKYLIVIFLLCASSYGVMAQNTSDSTSLEVIDNSVSSDTVQKKKGFFHDYPNPKKALLLSLIVPGTGQIYNKKYIKLPFVYGAFTGLILTANFNGSNYRRYRDAYALKLDGEPHEFSNTTIDDATVLRARRDSFRKNMELSYIFLGLAYVLNGIDAFVDAHLLQFDISDDLSMRVQPNASIINTGIGVGVSPGVSFKISLP